MTEFNKLTGITNKADEKKITQYEENVNSIREQLKQRFNEAKRWELRTAFLKDTEDRIRERVLKI